MEPVTREDLLRLEARMIERYATKQELRRVEETARSSERALDKLNVRFEGVEGALNKLSSNITWFTRALSGGIISVVIALIIAWFTAK